MTQPLGQIKKPSQSLYTNKRKLLLVPNFLLPGNTEEQKKILGQYWQDLIEPIQNLEKSLDKTDILIATSASLSIGLVSQSVITQATEGFQKTTKLRYESIANTIDKTLKENETGILFISEGHAIQFPSDIEVFYVTPPSVENVKNFIQEEIRQMQQKMNENISSDENVEEKNNQP